MLICSALGRSVLAVLGSPGLSLSRGRSNPGLCPGPLCSGTCAVGFLLPAGLVPVHGVAIAPLSCSWSPAAPSTRSHFLCPRRRHLAVPRDPLPPPHRAAAGSPQSCSWVNACALQPLGSSVQSPGSAGVCLCPMEPEGIPALLGSCSESLRASFPPGRMVQLLLLWDRALLPGGHSPWP